MSSDIVENAAIPEDNDVRDAYASSRETPYLRLARWTPAVRLSRPPRPLSIMPVFLRNDAVRVSYCFMNSKVASWTFANIEPPKSSPSARICCLISGKTSDRNISTALSSPADSGIPASSAASALRVLCALI